MHAKDSRGLAVITANNGMGKTFAVHCFAEMLDPATYPIVYLCHSTVGVRDFYRELCQGLGLNPAGSKPKLLKEFRDHISYMYKEQRRTLVLVIDEAQHLNTNILNDLKILMNQEYDSRNYFCLILVGEPSLKKTLSSPIHEALYQRITFHYTFQGLSEQELNQYVAHKLEVAGGSISIVDNGALKALKAAAHGNPRIVDHLMTLAFGYGIQWNKTRVTKDMILAADQARLLG